VIVALVPRLPTFSVSLDRRAAHGGTGARCGGCRRSSRRPADAIRTDKTGTLTQNRLSVSAVTPVAGGDALTTRRSSPRCNDARPVDGRFEGDPIDVALEWLAARMDVAALRRRCTHSRRAVWRRAALLSVTVEREGRRCEPIKAPEAADPRVWEHGHRGSYPHRGERGERVDAARRAEGDGAMTPLARDGLQFPGPRCPPPLRRASARASAS
jgi:hypothetical protein